MRFVFATLIASMVGLGLSGATAQASALDGSQVRTLVSGNKIFLKIPFGGEFPLRYQRNGVVQGDGTGVGLGRFLAPKDQGKWWIRNDRLCQQWEEWYDGRTTCFVIKDLKDRQFTWIRDDGREGKGRVE